jgi:PAS domain S-box-containing protein
MHPLLAVLPAGRPMTTFAILPTLEFAVEGALAAVVLGTGWWLYWVARKRAEKLHESEERFRELFEHAVEGVYENPAEGGFRRVNPAMARMLGFATPEDLMKVPAAETARLYVSPKRREEFFTVLGSGHQVMGFESEVQRADGTTIWISENVRAKRDAHGRLLYLQGFVSDITGRKQAEASLRRSEERYRELFQHSPVAILEIDSRPTIGRLQALRESGVTDLLAWMAANEEGAAQMIGQIPVIGINTAALQLLGAKSAEEVRNNLGRILTPEAVDMRKRALCAVWEGRNVVEGETRILALDGTSRTIYQRWWVPVEGERLLVERTQLAFVDLTQARSAESALAAERERLGVTLRAMTESVLTLDTAGAVLFMNEAASELTGWPAAGAVGRAVENVCALTEERTGRVLMAPVASALSADGPVDLPPHTLLRPRVGPPRVVEGRCAPMHDLTGRGIGAVLVLRDVTSRSRLEDELLRASKLESVGVLAGGIAHDFNNLLAIVMGNLQLALLDQPTAAAGGRWLREAERGTVRARELTQQLLTFAKGGEPVRVAVKLTDVVREAAEFALHGATVKCEFDLAGDVRAADADKGQIGQVVQNLVLNAVQAMPGGGVIRLRLGNDRVAAGGALPLGSGDYIKLSITDTGKGIAPEHLSRIFEPFFTTKQHGSGLGLATVYSVVQKHRGHVAVESEIGRGTTFHLWLPAARTEPVVTAVTAATFEPLQGRVLFMDDEEPIRVMTQTLLEKLGLEITVTSDGDEAVKQFALARVSGQPFDVVIMDLTVPGAMGGAAAMREILKLDPEARGIVSSGYSSDPVMANYREHGFRGSVPKPYRVSDFARTLREVMAED